MKSNHFPGSVRDGFDTPPPPPLPTRPKPPLKTISDPQQGAKVVRDGFGPSISAALSGGVSAIVGVQGFQEFRSALLKDLGEPKDPLATMFIDQLCWLHFRSAELLVAGASAKLQADQVAALTAAAARVIAEFRKSALALREYQSPLRQPANVTINANAQVAVVEGASAAVQPSVEVFDAKVSKPAEALSHDNFEAFVPEPKTRRRGPPEPVETRSVDRSGTAATTRIRLADSPLGGFVEEPPTTV